MPWGPEDWDDLTREGGGGAPCEPECVRMLHEILLSIPDPVEKVVGVLGDPEDAQATFLDAQFGKVVRLGATIVDAVEGKLATGRRRFDLIVAPGGVVRANRAEVDRSFEAIRDALCEGGIFVAGFPARSRKDAPFLVRLGRSAGEPDDRPLHEVELQYRLRRAGFQGLRIRRFRAEMGHPETVLCMAVRRALN